MPAGEYYVGDLCYVLHDRWDEFCSLTITGSRVLDGEFNLKDGTRFATYTTRWGDGTYSDEQGNNYDVDAGLIGCVALAAINFADKSNFVTGGRIVEFAQDFTTFSAGGVISFGTVSIDTDLVEEEELESEY